MNEKDQLLARSFVRGLFTPAARKGRQATLSVTQRTQEIVEEVAEATGRSRPDVLDAFVLAAYALYEAEKEKGSK